jgi:hypothetical protein
MVRSFAPQMAVCASPELIVDQREQQIERIFVTFIPRL